MPHRFQDAMALVMPGALFVISLDGVTVSLFPAADWARVKREILDQNKDGDLIIAFAEQEGRTVDADSRGRVPLPSEWPCRQQLRNKSVWVLWQETQILVLSAEPETD
jgi:hypothetical protein